MKMNNLLINSNRVINHKLLKSLSAVLVSSLLLSCGGETVPKDDNNVISKFNSTWNIHEKCEVNDDGTILYKAISWGGLVGTFLKQNMPEDLSAYESITFEFDRPAPVPMQVVVDDRFKTWGKPGIKSLTCNFDGQDVRSVGKILLQAADPCSIGINKIYFTPKANTWETVPIWSGNCAFGDWENGFVVSADKFMDAYEGDKLEFIYTADKSDPNVTYWLFKTIYSSTENTLEGNDNELNSWGCALVSSEVNVYRIVLTEKDIEGLREYGLFVNGYNVTVTQCNLLCKSYLSDESE